MSETKCFCHLGEYQVKDAIARAEIEKIKKEGLPDKEIENRIAEIETQLKAINETLEILTNDGDDSTVDLTEFIRRIVALENDLATVHTSIADYGTRITNLEGTRLTAIDENIAAIKVRLTALEGNKESVNTRLTALEGNKESVNTRLTALEGNKESVNTRLTALEGNKDNVNTSINELNTKVATLREDFNNLDIPESTPVKLYVHNYPLSIYHVKQPDTNMSYEKPYCNITVTILSQSAYSIVDLNESNSLSKMRELLSLAISATGTMALWDAPDGTRVVISATLVNNAPYLSYLADNSISTQTFTANGEYAIGCNIGIPTSIKEII